MLTFNKTKQIRNPFGIMGLVVVLWSAFSPLTHASTTPGSVPVAWDRNPETSVTGYKVYWGRTSRIYEQAADAGNNLQAVLPDLTPGQPYYCAVTAYNAEGQESAYSAEITVVYGTASENPDPTSGRLVMLEAENGQLNAPMAVFNGANESWVDTSSYSQLGWTELSFTAPVSGDYQVWCRVKAPTESKDSFFVMTDGGVEEVFHVYGTPTPPDGTRTTEWIWRRIHVTDAGPRTFTFDQGSHTIRFRVREPGTLLDRIVVSSDPAFVPTDALPRSGDAVVVTGTSGNLSAAPGSSATLAVSAAATGPVSYQWFKEGTAIPNAAGPLLSLQGLTTADRGSYTVRVIAGTATATSSAMVLSVNDSATLLPKLQVTRFKVNPDRSISFEVGGGIGSEIQIEASSDMVHWDLIGTQLNEFGVIDIADPAAAAGATRRFYRLVGGD
jgi:hypothetical protein